MSGFLTGKRGSRTCPWSPQTRSKQVEIIIKPKGEFNEGLLKVGQVLDRSEMKKIMAGSGDPGGGGGGCYCGTAPGCIYTGCSHASAFYWCLRSACMNDCNSYSCRLECVEQVNALELQEIADCGVNYS